MKRITQTAVIIIVIAIMSPGCKYFSQRLNKNAAPIDYNAPDFTGIRPFYEEGKLIKEESVVNGVKHGPTTTYFSTSERVRQVIYYKNGVQHDTAKWFYEDGNLFRTTPYVDGMMHGTQVQYYRSRHPRAILKYENGLSVTGVVEYNDRSQTPIKRNEEIVISIKDDYNTDLVYRIEASLNNRNTRVKWYRGDLVEGRLFDPGKVRTINSREDVGIIELQKGSGTNPGYVGIIAEIITQMGNRDYLYKRVPVPYRDVY